VGDYEVIGQLGSGGMGCVYRVRHVLSKRIEAMKLVLPDVERSGFIERFHREIEVQARLNHPNICALHTAVRLGNSLALIMELAPGVPLTEELQNGPLEPHRAVEYACQVVEALAHAHERGVIHRDVKPGNIMITAGGQAKLVDFGIAKLSGSAELTREGITVGSPYYMAPEVITGRRPDPRSDVYSAGVTLYEMVTGRRPIVGETQFAILQGHLQVQPAAPHAVNPRVPKPLGEAILKALAKDPSERYQTAGEFLAALRSIMQPVPPVRRRWRAITAPVLVAVGTLMLAGWFVSRRQAAPQPHVGLGVAVSPLPPAPAPPVAKAPEPTAISRQTKAAEKKKTLATVSNLPAAPAKSLPRIEELGMDSWGDVSWTNDSGWYVRKGGAPALYPHPAQGSFTFTIHRRKGNARWVLRWRNSNDFLLFEIDNKGLHRKHVHGGTTQELAAVRRKSMEKMLTLRIDVSPGAITHSLFVNGTWTVLDDWHDASGDFAGGQFGFWPGGGDEIGISNFKFMPMTNPSTGR
jgi:serine/threonine-protein kinase